MRASSIDTAKHDVKAALAQVASGFHAQSQTQPRVAVGLTKPRHGPDGFAAAIFSSSEEAARIAADAVKGEVVVSVSSKMPTPRVTRQWTQSIRRPLEDGQQIRPKGAPWVGTGGLFTVDGQVTNRHVVGMSAQPGVRMVQGPSGYANANKIGHVDPRATNLFDVAICEVDADLEARLRWNWGLMGEVRGLAQATIDHLNETVCNTGQTIGTQYGTLFAIGVDDQWVGYDEFTLTYNNLLVCRGMNAQPFSVPGHSGASIHLLDAMLCIALLFAGGEDDRGIDNTFACDMIGAIRHAGGRPELPS